MKTATNKGLPSWVGSIAFAAVLIVAAFVFRRPLALWFGDSSRVVSDQSARSTTASRTSSDAIAYYTCSMHPSVKQQTPGQCPICGMDLIPVSKEQQEQGVVMIDEARRQLIGVRTGKVIEAPMQRTFRAVGHVTYDESSLTEVNLKVRGWITKLFANQTGQHVTRGQPLFLLYSPDLYSAEQDYLLANQGNLASQTSGNQGSALGGSGSGRMDMLSRAARQRLHLLGLGDAQIDELAQKGVPSESISIPSPASGFIIEKNVVEGASVEAGMRLYRIAALNKVWVEADVYESDLPQVHLGQSATVTLDYLPGSSYDAKVAQIYPYLDPNARTGKVRVELANTDLDLRPGMFASVALTSDPVPRVQVPSSAVVYTGPRRLVFVDLGEGRFRPQEIQVGTEANGMYEVLSGLVPGDSVATSGVFLIAAEARISTAAKYWDKAPTAAPSATPLLIVPSASPPLANSPPVKPSAAVAPHSLKKAVALPRPATNPAAPAPAPSAGYWCPMHHEVRSTSPGKCPKCGMNLEPMPSGPEPSRQEPSGATK